MKVMTRGEWGATGLMGAFRIHGPRKYVVIHHTEGGDDARDYAEYVRNVERFHIDRNGWRGIAYSHLIAPDGTVFIGRAYTDGAHCPGRNRDSFGIAFIGTFTDKAPTDEALGACRYLLSALVVEGHLSETFAIGGHRDWRATECPGDALYDQLDACDPRAVKIRYRPLAR